MDPDVVSARLARWVAQAPPLPGPLDAATAALCRDALTAWAAPGALADKLARELTAPWQPLGRVLLIIAEHDVLGTLAGAIGALITGNQVRIKARTTGPLVRALLEALAPPPGTCQVLDWDSRAQDDAAVLADVDGVVIAGGADAIRHYRTAAPVGVRLIEFGPRLGVAAIAGPVDDAAALDRLAAALAHDATVFGGAVCSTPQLVLIDDAALAGRLSAALIATPARLAPLPDDARLANLVRARELSLLARLGRPIAVALEPTSGWGVTIGPTIDPAWRLPRGIALVTGPLPTSLARVAAAHRHQRQTLGTWGPVPEASGYSHRCTLGRMHRRALVAPHDGLLELAALVRFVSRDEVA